MMKQFFVILLSASISLQAMEKKQLSHDQIVDLANSFVNKKLSRSKRYQLAQTFEAQKYDQEDKQKIIKLLDIYLNFFDKTTQKEFSIPGDLDNTITELSFSPDNKSLAVGTWRGDLLVIEVATGHQLHHLNLATNYGGSADTANLGILAGSIYNIKWEDENSLQFDELRRFPAEKRTHSWNPRIRKGHAIIKRNLPYELPSKKVDEEVAHLGNTVVLNHTQSKVAYMLMPPKNYHKNTLMLQSFVPKDIKNALYSLSWQQTAALINWKLRGHYKENYIKKHGHMHKTLSRIPDNLKNHLKVPPLEKKK